MKKTSKTKIATVYATAIFDAVKNHDKILVEIQDLLETLKKDDDLTKFLSNPIVDLSIKKQVVESLKLSQEVKDSILVVTENNRSANIKEILEEFVSLYYKQKNIIVVDVVSTYALKEKQLKELEKKLVSKLGQEIIIKNAIDTDILGGLVIKYNSQMLDASVLGKIKNFEKLMKGENL
ncbi:MAG: ATP synthase F1 subunit delta [Alphaproteobacteria bacterium]